MKMKKENNKIVERRYDKFAIVSFVLGLLLVILTLLLRSTYSILRNGIISVGIITLCILSLSRIKRNKNLKGKFLAIISIFIVVVYVLAILLSVIFTGF